MTREDLDEQSIYQTVKNSQDELKSCRALEVNLEPEISIINVIFEASPESTQLYERAIPKHV
jgi:hypothetical protein